MMFKTGRGLTITLKFIVGPVQVASNAFTVKVAIILVVVLGAVKEEGRLFVNGSNGTSCLPEVTIEKPE